MFLEVGQSKDVFFELRRRDMSVWDVVAQQWRLQRADYTVQIGASSSDLRLNATVTIKMLPSSYCCTDETRTNPDSSQCHEQGTIYMLFIHLLPYPPFLGAKELRGLFTSTTGTDTCKVSNVHLSCLSEEAPSVIQKFL